MTQACSVTGCEREANRPGSARGLCGLHYARLRRLGDPIGSAARRTGHVERWVQEVALGYAGDDCLIWPFTRSDRGYAHWTVDGRPQNASRVICGMVHGDPKSPDLVAAHSCFAGASGCVNPRHLRWATASENEQDKVFSGTSNRGERHGQSKLTEGDVLAIRAMAKVASQPVIAKKFGVSKWTVSDIVRRKRWGWLP